MGGEQEALLWIHVDPKGPTQFLIVAFYNVSKSF